MSDVEAVNTAPEAANAEPETTVTDPTPEAQGTGVKDFVAKDTHSRVLSESRKYKERAQEAEKRLQEIETKKLEEDGKYKELAESYQQKLQSQQRVNMSLAVQAAVSEPARKAGCVNVDDLLKLGDASLLEYDADTGTVSGADHFVESAKNTRPWLFQQPQRPVTNPATPGGVPDMAPQKKQTLEDILTEKYMK